jgi:hypothetical protein
VLLPNEPIRVKRLNPNWSLRQASIEARCDTVAEVSAGVDLMLIRKSLNPLSIVLGNYGSLVCKNQTSNPVIFNRINLWQNTAYDAANLRYNIQRVAMM